MTVKVLTVSEINCEISAALKKHSCLWNCWVTGEISNYKNHVPSGHWYFTLKDEKAGIKAVMFKTRAAATGFIPENGMKVLVRGNIRLYEKEGSVQLYCEEIFPSGLGTLYLAYEQLKSKLASEGLFSAERKKAIPKYPAKIAIVTSSTGAALKDIVNIAQRRNPRVTLIVFPSAVQGEAAPGEIARAIDRANVHGGIDLLIVGRGGGSLEELWAFNSEEVARAIARSGIPVVSAVGHEIDYTIADFVADLRAPTPSAAAELTIPLLSDLQAGISAYREKLITRINGIIDRKKQYWRELSSDSSLARPARIIEQARQDLDSLSARLQEGTAGFINSRDDILKLISTKLDLLSPLTTLNRGYTLVQHIDGRLVKSAAQLSAGDALTLRFKDGKADCLVRKIDLPGSNDEKGS